MSFLDCIKNGLKIKPFVFTFHGWMMIHTTRPATRGHLLLTNELKLWQLYILAYVLCGALTIFNPKPNRVKYVSKDESRQSDEASKWLENQ